MEAGRRSGGSAAIVVPQACRIASLDADLREPETILVSAEIAETVPHLAQSYLAHVHGMALVLPEFGDECCAKDWLGREGTIGNAAAGRPGHLFLVV